MTVREDNLGSFVHGLRTARGLSARQVAAAANVAPSTLTRWENSQTLPRVPELHAVLQALAATPEQGAHALRSLRAPRATRHARRAETERSAAPSSPPVATVPPCASGDLLRALRLRISLTQADVARAVGVHASLVGAWERSEKWPSTSHLHAVCWHLGASQEEITALTTSGAGLWAASQGGDGRRAETPRDIVAASRARLTDLIQSSWPDSAPALADLTFLEIQGALWSLTGRREDARLLLSEVCAWRAFRLAQAGRYAEVAPVANHALALLPDTRRPPWFALYAVLSLAQSVVYRGQEQGRRLQAEKGLRVLRRWTPGDAAATLAQWNFANSWSPPLVFASWVESNRAAYFALLGRMEASATISAAAVEKAERGEDENETFRRRMDEIRLLLAGGLWREALGRAERMPQRPHPAQEADRMILVVHALLGAGARGEATSSLADTYATLALEPTPYWRNEIRSRADAVSRLL